MIKYTAEQAKRMTKSSLKERKKYDVVSERINAAIEYATTRGFYFAHYTLHRLDWEECGEWIKDQLEFAGYKVEIIPFSSDLIELIVTW